MASSMEMEAVQWDFLHHWCIIQLHVCDLSRRKAVKDRLGHEIYLTDERWHHICEEHPEMQRYRRRVLETLRRGRRFQDSVRPDVYLYYRDYSDLPRGNTTIVVVVRFGFDPGGTENNFILTAYQIRRRRRQD